MLLGPSLSGRVSNPLPNKVWSNGADLSSNEHKVRSKQNLPKNIRAHTSLVYLRGTVTRGKHNTIHFLLIAKRSQSHRHMVGSAIDWAKLWGTATAAAACLHRITHKHTRLKAECWFANELSWWQILPFNWLAKEAIRIQCVDAWMRKGAQGAGWWFLYIVCEPVDFRRETPIRRPQACHSLV